MLTSTRPPIPIGNQSQENGVKTINQREGMRT